MVQVTGNWCRVKKVKKERETAHQKGKETECNLRSEGCSAWPQPQNKKIVAHVLIWIAKTHELTVLRS